MKSPHPELDVKGSSALRITESNFVYCKSALVHDNQPCVCDENTPYLHVWTIHVMNICLRVEHTSTVGEQYGHHHHHHHHHMVSGHFAPTPTHPTNSPHMNTNSHWNNELLTSAPSMSVFSESSEGFSLQAFIPMTFPATFVVPAQ